MGFVEKRGKRYRARYRAPNGKEISKTFDRRTDADRFISVIEADKARGLWVDPALGRTEVADWSERWMRSMTHLKPKTRAGYESLLRCHVIPKFRSTPIAQVGQLDVQAWVSGMQSDGLSPSRIRQAKQVLGALMKTAHRSGYIARDPTEGIRLPRETPPSRSSGSPSPRIVRETPRNSACQREVLTTEMPGQGQIRLNGAGQRTARSRLGVKRSPG